MAQSYREATYDLARDEESGTIPPQLLDEERARIIAEFGVTGEQLAADADAARPNFIGGDAWG